MNHKRTTKRTLALSLLVMLLCVAMLVGTTFAWFTDSASTGVNTIQAGTLDVQLLDVNDNSLEGETLAWQKAAGHENDEVLWEPGCTYNLQPITIKNNGNLALKYKIVITGIQGDAELNNAIEWTITNTSATTALDADHPLAAGASDTLTIKGHMKESAGNEYQGKSIDGIAITVLATQATAEFDSTTNQYDADALYPVAVAANVAVDTNNAVTAPVTVESAEKVGSTNTPVAKVTIPAGAAVVEGTNQLKLTIDEVATPANIEVAAGTVAKTFEVDMKGLDKDSNTALFKVELYVGTGLTGFSLKHNGADMTKKDSLDEVAADQEYYYSSSTGVVTFLTSTFSPFTAVYDKESWSNHAAESYATPVDDSGKVVTIASAEELALFAKEVNNGTSYAGYTVKLTADIDLGKYNWKPIGKSGKTFQGTFDGQNHIISNLFINKPLTSDVGLFGFTTNGEVKNFTLHNAFVKGYLDVGAIAGTPYTSKYTNISLTGDVKVDGYAYVGGMFGKNAYANLTDLTIKVDEGSYVKADSEYYRTYVGGLVGFMGEGNITVQNVQSNIDVIGTTCDVGGITGIAHYNNSFINCHSSGDVTLTAAPDEGDELEIGGIAGVWHNENGTTVTFTNCSYTGTLSSTNVSTGNVTVFANKGLVGRQYSASGTGTLIIN